MKGLIRMDGYDCKLLYFTSVHHTAFWTVLYPVSSYVDPGISKKLLIFFSLSFDYISDGKIKNFKHNPEKVYSV